MECRVSCNFPSLLHWKIPLKARCPVPPDVRSLTEFSISTPHSPKYGSSPLPSLPHFSWLPVSVITTRTYSSFTGINSVSVSRPSHSIPMACSETQTVVRTTSDLTIPIRPPTDMLPIGPCLSSGLESPARCLVPLSLNQLKAGEIIQRVHGDAKNLVCSIEGLLQCRALPAAGAGHVVPKTILGNPALLTVQRQSRDITGDMRELIALSRREATLATRDSDHARRMRHHRRVIEERYRAARAQHQRPETDDLSQLVCHACNTRRTPQWRSGPAGPCTLCNVCGLVHAMRMRKLGRTRSKKVSAPSYTS
ncbi:uncharacterized protein LY79DRAFT_558508 [Colletotrichum navitas]|uniref:GATA-type domain-containing protein n=1 Tax=Colletotrichum navitas TaxID=681940 RepID=A0AAD8V466_9PEZI|nr:uncharacterized protein LY79DRAFT_558508 [Colletotrichum navitas]KAK1585414.1 hypothetical protein LY79DRAFT_558508 [Colletotrichum navitas]